jgi:peptidoglycan/xylan/chitin deacetylase (PgdA/CDA1 family)
MNFAQSETAPKAYRLYDFAFRALRSARIDRALDFIGGARGIIFALHRVRPYRAQCFRPNHGLEITPEFLEATIEHTQSRGLDFVSLDEALARLSARDRENFAVLTFDDGYRDTVEHAVPIIEKYRVPATIFVTSGFADRSAPVWWLTLEEAIRHVPSIAFPDSDRFIGIATDTPKKKLHAFEHFRSLIMQRSPELMRSTILDIARQAGINPTTICEDACLDWNEVSALAKHPLVTIGAHTVSHPVLSHCNPTEAMIEMARSRAAIEEHIDRPVRHFAYPNGDPASAGPREFSMAKAMGFASASTTRPGLVYDVHDQWTTALPRVSLNGFFQSLEQLDTMLTGAPFLLRNFGSRLDVS